MRPLYAEGLHRGGNTPNHKTIHTPHKSKTIAADFPEHTYTCLRHIHRERESFELCCGGRIIDCVTGLQVWMAAQMQSGTRAMKLMWGKDRKRKRRSSGRSPFAGTPHAPNGLCQIVRLLYLHLLPCACRPCAPTVIHHLASSASDGMVYHCQVFLCLYPLFSLSGSGWSVFSFLWLMRQAMQSMTMGRRLTPLMPALVCPQGCVCREQQQGIGRNGGCLSWSTLNAKTPRNARMPLGPRHTCARRC